MTISTVDTSSGPYVGNGIADTFEYDFKIFDKTQLTVLQTDTDGVTTTLAVDSDYTVTNVGEDDGGDIVLSAPLAADYQLFIRANIPVTQETDFESQGGFFPDVHEDAFDKLTLLIQQNAASLARAVRLSGDRPIDGDFVIDEDVDGRRNKVLRFDADGNIELVEFGSIEGLQNFKIQTVAVTAGVTEVTVPFTYLPNTSTIWVTVNGAYVPRSAYSELPGKIVFDNALSAGEVTFFGVSTAPVGTADAANVSYRETSTVEEALDGALQTVDTLAELLDVNTAALSNGDPRDVKSYFNGWAIYLDEPLGGGRFYWDESRAKSEHNGGTIVSPTVPWDGNTGSSHTDFLNGSGETEPSGSGCWVREATGKVVPQIWGARGDGATTDKAALDKFAAYLVANGGVGFIPAGIYPIETSGIDFDGFKGTLYGASNQETIIRQTSDNTAVIRISGSINLHDMRLEYQSIQPAANGQAKTINVVGEMFTGSLRNLQLHNGAYGIYNLNQVWHNISLDNIRTRLMSKSHIYLNRTGGFTGSSFSNIYMSGNAGDVLGSTCETPLVILGGMTDCTFNQINFEWMSVSNNAMHVNRANGLCMNGVHFEGISIGSLNTALIKISGGSANFNGVRVKSVNFSGGDPLTKTIGTVATSSIILTDDPATGEKTYIEIHGTNDNCTPAVTETRVLLALDAYAVDGVEDTKVYYKSWFDYDGLFSETPEINVTGEPSTPHMPVLRRYNSINITPFVRAQDDVGAAGGAGVVFSQISDDYNCYNTSTGRFTAPVNGWYGINYTVQTTNQTQIRVEDGGGVEQAGQRKVFGHGGGYSSGSHVIYLDAGHSIYVYNVDATTGDTNAEASFRLVS